MPPAPLLSELGTSTSMMACTDRGRLCLKRLSPAGPTLLSDRSDVRKGGVMQREPCLDIHHLAFQLGQLFVHPCEPEARRLLCNTSTNNQRGNGQSLPLLALLAAQQRNMIFARVSSSTQCRRSTWTGSVPKLLTQWAHSETRCCTTETKWSSSHDCFALMK
jgi:hypothetical protein